MKKPQKMIGISLDTYESLKKISEQEDLPVSIIVKLLVRQYVKKNNLLTLN